MTLTLMREPNDDIWPIYLETDEVHKVELEEPVMGLFIKEQKAHTGERSLKVGDWLKYFYIM